MLKHPTITLERLQGFLQEYLSSDRLYGERVSLGVAVSRDAGIQDEGQARLGSFTSVNKGFQWGPVWSTAWFHVTGRVPEGWTGEHVRAVLDLGPEVTVWKDNCPREGIDREHHILHYEGGDEVDLICEAYTGDPNVSAWAKPVPPPEKPCTVGEAFLFLPDARLWSFYYDYKVALQLLQELPLNEPRFGRLLYAMNACVNAFLSDGMDSATAILREEWVQPANASAHQISAIGHAHIDTAWLWPLAITRKKCAHTFATATRYMELYPDYKFVCSQAVQYEWMRETYPALFERIKDMVRRGQWEITGSMWVEADCNLASGEGLVRQFLYGKRYFQEHFGIETTDMWLPDVFGYAASLPQILKLSGIDIFMTQKISWNRINKFPHHTFLWRGIDGTEVFSHFLPADDYNASMTPKQLIYNVHNFKEHDRATRSLYVYGYGDGGGGPTTEMLEFAGRLRDIEGLPRVELEKAADFFRKAKEDARDLPVWSGELYLECHRGTYTSQAANKKNNRKCELLLRDVEMLSAMLLPADEYPRDELDCCWKSVLLNQFHDILPGSSVNEVYRDSDRDYQEVFDTLKPLVDHALGGGQRLAAVSTRERGAGGPVLIPDPSGVHSSVRWEGGEPKPVQRTPNGLLMPDPPVGIGVIGGELGHDTVPSQVRGAEREIENEFLRLQLDAKGDIASIVMKTDAKEVLSSPAQLQMFEDLPNFWDAWDIDVFAYETMRPVGGVESVVTDVEGPVTASLIVRRSFGNSSMTQTISLSHGCPYVQIDTEIDWHEDRKLLKAAFPVNINSGRATYEIQYGHVERPTHYNTSWDMARFEVCAHKWVDLSEGGWGVALINDCKYGHDIHDNVIRLSLLKAPKAPDPEADMGRHAFSYWLYPHDGDFRKAGVVSIANRLNSPARVVLGDLPPVEWIRVPDVGGPKVIVEAVKRAEDSDAIVVRLYEAHNARGVATVHFGFPVSHCTVCDLLERDIHDVPVHDNTVKLEFLPFQILSLKLT